MKVLVSSKSFSSYIPNAINNNTTHVEICGKTSSIEFYGDKSFKIFASPINNHSNFTESIYFINQNWKDMLKFLEMIPEQPIVIEFTTDNKIEISNIIAVF